MVCILCFFKFRLNKTQFPCALVTWFSPIDDEHCEDMGMWIVEPDIDYNGQQAISVIHIGCILRSAHLIGVAGKAKLPQQVTYSDSLDAFKAFYVNKFVDHQSHEIAF